MHCLFFLWKLCKSMLLTSLDILASLLINWVQYLKRVLQRMMKKSRDLLFRVLVTFIPRLLLFVRVFHAVECDTIERTMGTF